MPAADTNDELVDLVGRRARSYLDGGERDPRVLAAMRAVDRALFLPPESLWAAYRDEPAPIGRGQTCSQPSMVAFMAEALEVEGGQRLLEVGSGCGYAAAILSRLCSPGGLVLTAELSPELAALAEANCRPFGDAIRILRGDASAGWPSEAPFDRILLSAGVRPRRFREEPLLAQLAVGGILLYPEERGDLIRIRRRGGKLERDSWSGVAFVPLRGANA